MTDNEFNQNGGHYICSIPGSIGWWREYRGEQRVLPDMTFSGYKERKGTKHWDGENLVECDLCTTELEQQTGAQAHPTGASTLNLCAMNGEHSPVLRLRYATLSMNGDGFSLFFTRSL